MNGSSLHSLPVACDVLVIGSGAGGLSTAIVARKAGLNVVLIEKAAVVGGTTAYSGGVLWIPGNPHAKAAGIKDSRAAAETYLRHETGNWFDEEAVALFLDKGPEMLEYFERETEARFLLSSYPDYHPKVPGGVEVGRSVTAAPYDASRLGPELARLRPPLKTITFIGMMFNSSNADLKHFFRATKSLASAWYVAKRLASHIKDMVRHGRGVQVTSGNALVARLFKTALDLDIPIITEAQAIALLRGGNRVSGARIAYDGREKDVEARIGIVLAAGGFPHDTARVAQAYPHVARGGEHVSPVPEDNSGDGVALAESVGAAFDLRYPNAAAWMPVSEVPMANGRKGVFPHLVDRYKPGIIAVDRSGRRFTNEANSYHDVGRAIIDAGAEQGAWLICDHATIRKYGLGHAKPAPVPISFYVRNGYLVKGRTLAALAQKAGIDPAGLTEAVRGYNEGAVRGEDPAFGRGGTAFNRFLGDPDHRPNPNVGPIGKGPYYALRLKMGDLGSFDGLTTDPEGSVLDRAGAPIPGLYAAGNDRASMMGGNYPGAGITLGPIMTFGYVTGQHLADLARNGRKGDADSSQKESINA